MNKEKEYVFIMTDSPLLHTSYARVGKQMAEWLSEKYNVIYFATQANMGGYETDKYKVSSMMPMQIHHDSENLHFKFGIYLRNAWVFTQLPFTGLEYLREKTDKIYLYTPVEELKIPQRFLQGYGKIYDEIITMSQDSKRAIKEHGIDAHVLYHAFSESLRSRNEVDGDWILTLSYSQDYRKALSKIYSIAHEMPNKKFLLSGKSTYYTISDLRDIYKVDNVSTYYMLTNQNDSVSLSDAEVAQLYGVSHCYLQPSIKEGFDLTVMESLVNGLLVFMPDDPLHHELFNDFPNGFLLPVHREYPGKNQMENMVFNQDFIHSIEQNADRPKYGFRLPERFREGTIKRQLLAIVEK